MSLNESAPPASPSSTDQTSIGQTGMQVPTDRDSSQPYLWEMRAAGEFMGSLPGPSRLIAQERERVREAFGRTKTILNGTPGKLRETAQVNATKAGEYFGDKEKGKRRKIVAAAVGVLSVVAARGVYKRRTADAPPTPEPTPAPPTPEPTPVIAGGFLRKRGLVALTPVEGYNRKQVEQVIREEASPADAWRKIIGPNATNSLGYGPDNHKGYAPLHGSSARFKESVRTSRPSPSAAPSAPVSTAVRTPQNIGQTNRRRPDLDLVERAQTALKRKQEAIAWRAKGYNISPQVLAMIQEWEDKPGVQPFVDPEGKLRPGLMLAASLNHKKHRVLITNMFATQDGHIVLLNFEGQDELQPAKLETVRRNIEDGRYVIVKRRRRRSSR